MSLVYISKRNVREAISYFESIKFIEPTELTFYLGFKHFGLSQKKPVIITPSQMDEDYKNEYADLWIKMYSLLDLNEKSEKIVGVSPFSLFQQVSKNNMFNPGSTFNRSTLCSRPKDSLKNLLRTNNFLNFDTNVYSYRNTEKIVEENFLNGNKISLKHFTAWFFRFYGLDIKNLGLDEMNISLIAKKKIIEYFQITKNDFTWLFEDDIYKDTFDFEKVSITGEELREAINFTEECKELFSNINVQSNYINNIVANDEFNFLNSDKVAEFSKLNGDNPSAEDVLNTLLLKKQLILTGVPGTGKTRMVNELSINFDFTEVVQFHPSFSYEDFIGGETLEDGNIITRVGIFLDFCLKANKNPEKTFLFVIDELNRGNIPQIFGETIMALDRNYIVKLSKKLFNSIDGNIVETFNIPNNLYILGTMNTSDRNIAFLDLAIRRRFAFIELTPNYELVSNISTFRDVDLGMILQKINNRIRENLNSDELLLGQSYFLNDDIRNSSNGLFEWSDKTFQAQFNYVILPTIKEYSFSDSKSLINILGIELSSCILNTEKFIDKFYEEFIN